MFPNKFGLTVQNAKLIKLILLAFISQESEEHWLKENAITSERRKVMVDKNIRFNVNSQKPPRNKPCVLNAKYAATCIIKTAYVCEN